MKSREKMNRRHSFHFIKMAKDNVTFPVCFFLMQTNSTTDFWRNRVYDYFYHTDIPYKQHNNVIRRKKYVF